MSKQKTIKELKKITSSETSSEIGIDVFLKEGQKPSAFPQIIKLLKEENLEITEINKNDKDNPCATARHPKPKTWLKEKTEIPKTQIKGKGSICLHHYSDGRTTGKLIELLHLAGINGVFESEIDDGTTYIVVHL